MDDETSHTSKPSWHNELGGICSSTSTNTIRQPPSTDGLHSYTPMDRLLTTTSADRLRITTPTNGIHQSTSTDRVNHGKHKTSTSMTGVQHSTRTDGIRRSTTDLQTFLSNQRELINLIGKRKVNASTSITTRITKSY